ncbi:N-ethylmaleimide reductase [Cupriavidus alkaliphilus]|nr:N-ethylmaleimide reductase [Cupriavidus alkaliphilus]
MSQPVRTDLFAPLKLGALPLQHRIVLNSPRALQHGRPSLSRKPPSESLDGALVIYAVAEAHCAEGRHLATQGIANAGEVNGWLRATQAVHDRGGMVVARIGGCPVPPGIALNADQVDLALDAYRSAAENAHDAGFDGIELAAMAGTLPEQLYRQWAEVPAAVPAALTECPVATEFLCDALRTLLAAWPPDRVGACMTLPATAAGLRRHHALLPPVAAGELAYLHLHSTGSGHATYCKPFTASVRLHYRGPLIVTGVWTPELAATAVRSGRIEAVGVCCEGVARADELAATWRAQLGVHG